MKKPAEQVTVRHGEGVLYTCSNDACGRYFLSNPARMEIEDQPDFYDRKSLSDAAHEAKEKDQWLCLRVDPTTGSVHPKIVPNC